MGLEQEKCKSKPEQSFLGAKRMSSSVLRISASMALQNPVIQSGKEVSYLEGQISIFEAKIHSYKGVDLSNLPIYFMSNF